MRLSETIERRILAIANTIEDHEAKSKAIKILLAAHGVEENFLASMIGFSGFVEILAVSILHDSLVYEVRINHNLYALCLLTRKIEFSASENRIINAKRYYQIALEYSVAQRTKKSVLLLSNLEKIFKVDRENPTEDQYGYKHFLLRKCQLCKLFVQEKPKQCLELLCEWLSKDTHYIKIIEQDTFLKNHIKQLIESHGAQLTSMYSPILNYIKTIIDPILATASWPIQ